MRTNHVAFSEAELPKPEYSRLLTLIFGGLSADTHSPAVPFSAVAAGAGLVGVDADQPNTEPGAIRPSSTDALPSVPARPGSVTTEAVA